MVMGPASRALKMKLSFKHYFLNGRQFTLARLSPVQAKEYSRTLLPFHRLRDPDVVKEKNKARSTAMVKIMDRPGYVAVA